MINKGLGGLALAVDGAISSQLGGGPAGIKGKEGGILLARTFSLSASWLPWNEQLHVATSSCSDGLSYHSPRNNRAKRWRTEAAETMTKINFSALRCPLKCVSLCFPLAQHALTERIAQPVSPSALFIPAVQHWLLAPISTAAPSGVTHYLLLVTSMDTFYSGSFLHNHEVLDIVAQWGQTGEEVSLSQPQEPANKLTKSPRLSKFEVRLLTLQQWRAVPRC